MVVPFFPSGAYNEDQLRCFGDCLFLHEAIHASIAMATSPTVCWGMPRGTQVRAKSERTTRQAELRAFEASIPCVQSKILADPDDRCGCRKALETELKNQKDQLWGHEWWLSVHGKD
jgi:hypothetical protein